MNGLPENFDGGFLRGHKLQRVSFGVNQVSLVFDGEILVAIEGAYAHIGHGFTDEYECAHPPPSNSRLMSLLGNTVRNATGTRDGTLTIEFEDGQQVACFDDPQYEAYEIHVGENRIIV